MTSKLLCLKISQPKLVGQDVSVCPQLCLALCNPWTVTHQASLSMEFSRQEYWSRIAISYSRGSSQLGDPTRVSYVSLIGGWILYHCINFIETEDKTYLHIKNQVFYTFYWMNNISLKMKHIVISINDNRGNLIFQCPKAFFGEFAQGIIPLII